MLQIIVIAAASSALALTALMWLAPRLGWLDRPDPRKPHLVPIPPVGGVSWLPGLLVAWLAVAAPGELHLLAVVLVMMLLIGLLDDVRPLPSVLRLALQSALAGTLAWTGIARLGTLGHLLPGIGPAELGVLAMPMTIFAMVGVINAVNMADGMDGLAGSYLLLCLLAIAALHLLAGRTGVDLMLALAAAAALLPFLCLNIRFPWQQRARVFFGDAGSMAAGLLLATLLVRGSQGVDATFAPTVALWLLAVPLVDTVSVMLRRVADGRSPLTPDQQHVHHLLLRSGLPVARVWQILSGTALLAAGAGVGFEYWRVPGWVQFLLFMASALGYHTWVSRGLRRGALCGRTLRPGLSQI